MDTVAFIGRDGVVVGRIERSAGAIPLHLILVARLEMRMPKPKPNGLLTEGREDTLLGGPFLIFSTRGNSVGDSRVGNRRRLVELIRQIIAVDEIARSIKVRLDGRPVTRESEMQVRVGATARATCQAQKSPGGDDVSDLNRDRVGGEVVVLRLPAIAVVDDDVVSRVRARGRLPVEVTVSHKADRAIGSRVDGNAGVHASEVREREVVPRVSVIAEEPAGVVFDAGSDIHVVVINDRPVVERAAPHRVSELWPIRCRRSSSRKVRAARVI